MSLLYTRTKLSFKILAGLYEVLLPLLSYCLLLLLLLLLFQNERFGDSWCMQRPPFWTTSWLVGTKYYCLCYRIACYYYYSSYYSKMRGLVIVGACSGLLFEQLVLTIITFIAGVVSVEPRMPPEGMWWTTVRLGGSLKYQQISTKIKF
jgi:hypothetical protein